MKSLWQDIRYSLRRLAREPGFAVAVVLTLAIALGANTAVFSVLNGVLLRALPYSEPQRIVSVSVAVPARENGPARKDNLDNQRLESWAARTRTLEKLAAFREGPLTLRGRGEPERVNGASVSAALFPLLRVAPLRGRTFRVEEQRPGAGPVVVLSHGLWRRRFQSDPGIVGKTLSLDGTTYTIIGVMPRDFYFPNPQVQLWIPLANDAPAEAGEAIAVHYDAAVARLRDGVTRRQAEAEAQAIFQTQDTRRGAEPLPGRVELVPLRDEIVAEVRPALLAMFAAVGLVLLIACINLANLLLARSSSRQREIAVRSALGGGRARLIRQMLTESLVLSLAGGIAGMLLAVWLHRILPRVLPSDIPRLEEVRLDGRVFLFALVLSGLAGLLSGLLPAVRATGRSLVGSLYGWSVGVASRLWGSRSLLLITEVAVAFVLVVAAGLLVRSFLELVSVDLGFEPEGVLTATVDLDPLAYGAPAKSEAFFDQLLDRLGRQPGIEAVGVVSFSPPASSGFGMTSLSVVGQPPARTIAVPQAVSPGTLRAMGLRLAAGRWLTAQDHASRARVAVVNEAFARKFILGPMALGRHLEIGSATFEIVGVVEDVHLRGPDSEPKPEVFTSYRQTEVTGTGLQEMTVILRTSGNPAAFAPLLRSAVHALDPAVPLDDVRPMADRLSSSVARPRFYALLLGAFALIALVLTTLGVYGVLSYFVARQTRAIGVRRALGAERRDILSLVLGRGFLLVAVGLGIGVAVAAGATRLVAHLLFGITPGDPLVYLIAALSLLSTAVLACYLPALRATRIDPVEALRHEG